MARKAKKDRKAKKEKGPFRYTRGGPDPYHAQIAFLQTQAHNNQVEALLKQLGQAQAHAKNARREAFEEAYANVQPMQQDRPGQYSIPQAPTPPTRTDVRMTAQPPRITTMQGALREHAQKKARREAVARGQQAAAERRGTPQPMVGLTEQAASHIAHTVEPTIAAEIFRFAASGEAPRAPKLVDYNHEAYFPHRMNRLHGAEHGGIPTPEGVAAYKQALLEMRSRDDAARSGYLPFSRVSTGNEFAPAGRDFKAARVDDPTHADLQAVYNSYLEARLPPRV